MSRRKTSSAALSLRENHDKLVKAARAYLKDETHPMTNVGLKEWIERRGQLREKLIAALELSE